MELHKYQGFDVVLVCGLPGSGKSHFAATYFKTSGHMRVNRKEIRRLLYEMTHFGQKWAEKDFAASDEFLVKHVERKIIEHLLQEKQKVLVDNTSISRDSRKAYLTLAHQAGKSIGAIFIDTPVIKCMERNRSREDSVPERIISNLRAEMELPDVSEGYKDVMVIDSY